MKKLYSIQFYKKKYYFGENLMPKKILAFLLCMILTLSFIVSCASPKEDKGSSSETSVDESDTAETEIPDNLPEQNFEGHVFNVLTKNDNIGINEEDGEILNDVEYIRDVRVEDRFNIKIEADYHEAYGEGTSMFKKMVAAGTEEFEMVFIHMIDGAALASEGSYYPINDLEYINLEKIWWDKQIQNGFSVGKKLFLAAGDILPDTLLRTSCMAFNKKQFDDLTLTYPYQTAFDGKWTLDTLYDLTKGATRDLNGDGAVKVDDDFYGLTSWYLDSPYSFYYGAGGSITKKDANDIPELDLDVEKNLAIYMKIFEVVVTNESNYIKDMNQYAKSYDTFTSGRALFCEICLTHLKGDKWRNMDEDYGVVPIPKYDEKQTDYLGFVNGDAAMMGVPISIKNPERTSIIIEALAAESYKRVTPALYEVVAKTKHTRDEESSDMIDMVIRERIFDFGYTHLLSNGISSFVRDLLASKKTDVASSFARNEKSLTNTLAKIIAAYEKNT